MTTTTAQENTMATSLCCNESISRAQAGTGTWTCDNCHKPVEVYATTAENLKAGDHLARVQQRPLSAVFSDPIDATVLAVEPGDRGRVHIVLEPKAPARASALNLDPERAVYVRA